MNIKIPVDKHCIETEIKRRYNRAISAYFKAGDENEKKDLESSIDLLHHALEKLDFNHLRNRYKDLRGESQADVRLFSDDSGAIRLSINGDEIETTDSN
ncbi:MAG: hypothetical protein KGY38_03050 [Desulfobacterales bacterium]|nr:hypothetical protein [Desulfobacterales bacterium]